MQFLAGASGGNVENAAGLLRFAVAINAINPGLRLPGILAFRLQWCDEEFGNFGARVGVFKRRVRFGRKAALEPREQLAAAAGDFGLQVGDDDDFELQTLGFVDGHQLHAAVAGGGGVGECR